MKKIGLLIILSLFIYSCSSLYKPSMYIKIVTTSLEKSSNKAKYSAYQKNLVVQNDFGCNPDKGNGVAIAKYIGGAFIGEATYHINERYCTNYKRCDEAWTKEESRTQGGGWIWWTGRAHGDSLFEVSQKAKAVALKRLVQECESIPKETKFHEQCAEYVDSQYIVKVRASTKDIFCRRNKDLESDGFIHNELSKIILKY